MSNNKNFTNSCDSRRFTRSTCVLLQRVVIINLVDFLTDGLLNLCVRACVMLFLLFALLFFEGRSR